MWLGSGPSTEKVYQIYPKVAGGVMSFFISGPNYLDLMLYGFLGPKSGEPQSAEQQKIMGKWRLPDLLEEGNWRIVHEQEALDGAECLVIESSNGDRLWLDPQLGYAVRRWTQTAIPWDVRYFDFQQVSDDFYVPHKIVSLDYVPQEASAGVSGPALRTTDERAIESGSQSTGAAETFRLTPPAGASCSIILSSLSIKMEIPSMSAKSTAPRVRFPAIPRA